MDRLQSETQRLYGEGRALALAVQGRGSWDALSRLWQGVQADLQWPAPGIAVDGAHGYQLWFSFAEPLPAVDAPAWLERLRTRYLGDLPPERISRPASPPPCEVEPGHWSAFVAADLAPIFSDEPWLDIPPGADAQADLLARLRSIQPADLQRLAEAPAAPAATSAPAPTPTQQQDPRAFLLAVMNDAAVPLPLRIEAAKALLAAG